MAEPPPPPPPPLPRSNLPMLYYGLIVVGTAVIVLTLYNLVVVKWCTDFTDHRTRRQRADAARTQGGGVPRASSSSFDTSFVSSFAYRRDEGMHLDGDCECSVCLSVFEEGEELRRLPKCGHSFHAVCIDMWLYSHMDCPLCRSPVEPPAGVAQRRVAADQSEHSREGLLGPDSLV